MRNLFRALMLGCLICSLASCQSKTELDPPNISCTPAPDLLKKLNKPFERLDSQDLRQDWGKELHIGIAFAEELDLYRAISAFKRSLILLPPAATQRRLQIEYSIALCYYLGKKYNDTISTFETGSLVNATSSFPAYCTLLIILYDSYVKACEDEKAEKVHALIEQYDPNIASDLTLSETLWIGDVPAAYSLALEHRSGGYITEMLDCYCQETKSPFKAQALNAILPGSGYLYIGQKKSAFTSFIINALFITAAVQFFDRGYVAAGIITAGFETGWYLGGINGAANGANEYNRCLYEGYGKQIMQHEKLFPALMFNCAF